MAYWHLHLLADFAQLAEKCVARCGLIAGFSETGDSLTRTFLSNPMRDCHRAISAWMEELGMRVSLDAIGNLHGLYGSGTQPRRLLMGSHLDTVPCAGAYDGVLGVCVALAVVEALRNVSLPFDVEVLGFSEEEGVRFRVPFLGSLATVGCFDPALLDLQDSSGHTVREAIQQFGLDPARIPDAMMDTRAIAYLEFHIEQGPVLDTAGESIAAVRAIAGQSRLEVVFVGRANHAGTTPMELRRDALSGAAEWIMQVEEHAQAVNGLVATVGKMQVSPGGGNIIPGEVRASLDVRHSCDETRTSAVRDMCRVAAQIAFRRGLELSFKEQLNQPAVPMNQHLVDLIEKAILRTGEVPRRMVSGAGHDAMILAKKAPAAMIFIRSIGGISHHPDESVHVEDVEKAIRAGSLVLTDLAVEGVQPA
ncbi:MAG TPA: allantoate amidohydrolase [Bryobacteraceae bacterium]|nr:allantoate amidohydrolase [Bryobacteraceae bacterium]